MDATLVVEQLRIKKGHFLSRGWPFGFRAYFKAVGADALFAAREDWGSGERADTRVRPYDGL